MRSTKNDFLIKTQLCKLGVILRSRVLRGVCTLVKDTTVVGDFPANARVKRTNTFNLLFSARKLYSPALRGTKPDICRIQYACVNQVYYKNESALQL